MVVKSPLTASNNIKQIRKVEVLHIINEWKKAYGIDINEEMKSHQFIFEYKCVDTSLNFFVPEDLAGSGQLYEQLQKFDWYYDPNKWEHRITLTRLKSASKILEVGCGEGGFIRLCKQQGHFPIGIELNAKAVVKAKAEGLEVYERNLDEFANEHLNYYDCVCSYQVLEHVSKPKDFIEGCIKVLRPGGKLIFCVPNLDGLLASDDNLLDMPPHHMTRWNKSSFKSLESLFPIKISMVYYEPLAKYHWLLYFRLVRQKFIANRVLRFFFLLDVTSKVYKWMLSLGFNRFIKGHTIYVEFVKDAKG